MGFFDILAERAAKEREWLDGLKVGDQVVINWSFSHSLQTVTHCTPTEIHVGGTKYRRKSGFVVGHSRGSISMPTPEIVESIEKESLVGRVANMRWDYVRSLSVDQLRRIAAILDEAADSAPAKPAGS